MAKKCIKCGQTIRDSADFCPHCGTKAPETKYFCTKCGTEVTGGADVCPNCGATIDALGSIKRKIYDVTGGEGKVAIRFIDMFSGVFKKHTDEERSELFCSGTKYTTPSERDMIASWPKPWLYSRVFVFLAVTFFTLYAILYVFDNAATLFPGLMLTGSLTVPLSFLIFFWEFNVPRNIDIFYLIRMFFVGGVLSMVSTFINYAIVGDAASLSTFMGACFIAIVEEIGKMAIVLLYVNKLNSKYILNGLLIGAAIGAGFAFFETFGYVFWEWLENGFYAMMNKILLRGILSVGGHIAWTAIAGAAFVAAKNKSPQIMKHLGSPTFITLFITVIALHAIWDAPTNLGEGAYWTRLVILVLIALAIIFIMLMVGLRQVERCVKEAIEESEDI